MEKKAICDFDQCANVHTHECPYISCGKQFSCTEDWCSDMRNYMKLCVRCEPLVNALSTWLGQYDFRQVVEIWKRYTGEKHGMLNVRKRCAPIEKHRQIIQAFIAEYPNESLLAREIRADNPNALAIAAAEALDRWVNR